ncbi:MAG: hypothetical protein WC815_00815 [Vicinamibacterales bacterium]|jgi:hypothetical protein
MQNTKRTTMLSTDVGRGCEHCGESVGFNDSGDLAPSINHYIEQHGYSLLHVGQQSSNGNDGKPYHHTVAVLGHDNPPDIPPVPDLADYIKGRPEKS